MESRSEIGPFLKDISIFVLVVSGALTAVYLAVQLVKWCWLH